MASGSLSPEFIKSQISSGIFKVILKRKAISAVWDVFRLIEIEDGRVLENYVYCRECKNIYKYKGTQTTNLLRHKCYIAIKTEKEETIPVKLNADIKSDVTKICANWTVEDCRAFSSVDGTGFKEMVKFFIKLGAKFGENVDIDDLVPHSTTISRHINEIADRERNKIKAAIKQEIKDGAAITSDLWTDNYIRRSYLSATLHYIKDDSVHEIALGLKSMDFQKTSGVNINKKMKDILNDYDITNLDNIVFVTDRGSNMISAFNSFTRINCSNHLLNNVLEDAFDETHQLDQTISECKKLVKYFKKANLQYLLESTLKSHCTTRWSSHYTMFNSIFQNWVKITEILQEKHELNRLSLINNILLKSLADLCEHFYNVSKKLQGSQYVTLHYVHTTINFIKTICQPSSEDLQEVAVLKLNILHGVSSKWIPNLSIYHKIAFFLYPPTNQLRIFDSATVVEIKKFCFERMLKYLENSPECAQSQVSEPIRPHRSSDEIFFSGLINDTVLTNEQIIRNEIDKYSNVVIKYFDKFDVLKWWLDHKTEYLNLYRLSKQIFCIPASSAPSERIFSLGGNIITEKRNKIYPKTVNNVIFLNSIKKRIT